MSHAYHANLVHLVFSTKGREDLINSKLQDPLWRYFVGIARNHDFKMLASGGTANHAHLLYLLPATMPLAESIQVLKTNSSRWMGEHTRKFQWQRGYGAFSVSESNSEKVKTYIANQLEHHRRHSFEQEYLSLLKKHKIAFDMKYVFD